MIFCEPFADLQFLFFTSQIPQLLYYSHIPTALIALLIGFFIYRKSPDSLAAKILCALTVVFALWNFLNLIVWTNPDSRLVMLAWSFFALLYALMYILSVYFAYAFVDGKDVSGRTKALFILLLLPSLLLYATPVNLASFDIVSCEAVENIYFTAFYHAIGLVAFFWILGLLLLRFFRTRDNARRRQITLFGIGIELFLLSFTIASFWASYIDNFELEQYGLFGMVVFLGFLGYLIVRYQAFDLKVVGAQALVIALVMLIGSQFFFIQNVQNYILNGIGFALSFVAGYFLIRSVQKEVERKEELQRISDSLARANERLKELDQSKSEFISIASHQLRTPLTAIKGYISLLLEGSYGKVPATIEDTLNKVYSVNDRLIHLVEDLLNVSRIEAGRIQYTFEETQVESLMADLVDSFKLVAKSKGLALTLQLPKTVLPKLMIDPNKLKEVASNIIDNALKYTKEGGVDVAVENTGTAARIRVKDTGIGIKPEDQRHLFQKFVRSKETTRMVVGGAGLGLFVGKSFIEAMGGRIWAESEGAGKGSTFIIELPLSGSGQKAGITERPSA